MANNFLKIRNGINLKPQGSDPAGGQDGDIYFNNVLNKYRGYSNGAWRDLGDGGQGVFNYVSNPSASDDASTGIQVTGTFAADRGTDPSVFANNYFKIDTGLTELSSISWETNTLQEKDNGTLKKFSMEVLTPTTTNTYVVDLYDGTAQVPGTEHTLVSAHNHKIEALFVMDVSKTYTVRLRRTAGTTDETLYVTNVFIGEEGVVVGSAITDWTDTTVVFTNIPQSSQSFKYKRIGSDMILRGRFVASGAATGTITMAIPSGFTINYANLPTNNTSHIGYANAFPASSPGRHLGIAVTDGTSTTQIVFTGDDGSGVWTTSVPFTWANNDRIELDITIPIAEWSGEQITYANSRVEYSSFDGTSGVFGPDGALVPNIPFGDGVTTVDIVTAIPFKNTNSYQLELNVGGRGWSKAEAWAPFYRNGNRRYGISHRCENATTYRVNFGNGGILPVSPTAPDGEASWAAVRANGTRFRLVASANPLGIGAGLVSQSNPGLVERAGQLLGTNTDDDALPGRVGEVIRGSRPLSNQISAPNDTPVNVTSITLTGGAWSLSGAVQAIAPSGGATFSALSYSVSRTSGTTLGGNTIANPTNDGEFTLTERNVSGSAIPAGTGPSLVVPTYEVKIPSGTTVTLYLVVRAYYSGASSNASLVGFLEATRKR